MLKPFNWESFASAEKAVFNLHNACILALKSNDGAVSGMDIYYNSSVSMGRGRRYHQSVFAKVFCFGLWRNQLGALPGRYASRYIVLLILFIVTHDEYMHACRWCVF